MNKVSIKIILLLLIGWVSLQAQQRPLYSQYMLNRYLINPGYTGINDYFEATTNFRYQWVGLVDAPRTYALTVHGPNNSKKLGFGGSLYNDVTGPTSKTGINFSFAKHIQITAKQNLSLGVSGGLMQFKIDGTKVTVFDPGDQVLANQRMTTLIPDLGFGLYWYQKNKFYLGASVPQLFYESPISFVDNNDKVLSNLTRHFFLNGGYTFHIGTNFDIEPSFLVKYTEPVNAQFDLGARIIFKELIWLGAVYRTEDAVSAVIGYTTSDQKLTIGYSYDFTTSNIQNYSFGTHEIMLSARFGTKKGYSAKGKAKKSEFEQLKSKLEKYELEELEREEEEKKLEEEKEKAKVELKELEQKDLKLREKIRKLREEATVLGFESPKDNGFGKRQAYINALEELKSVYTRKKELERKLNK